MSSFALKIFACICMLIDHIGFAFYPDLDWLRIIGRLAFPIFAFQISIGYDKTHNKQKYILRMLLFTILSQYPFDLLRRLVLFDYEPELNIGATLLLGLLSIYAIDKLKNPLLKYLVVASIISLAIFIPMDYGWYGVVSIIIFYVFRKNKTVTGISYCMLLSSYCWIKKSIFNLPSIYSLFPILLYNGEKGKNIKYFFYLFYPIHILLLAIIKLIL